MKSMTTNVILAAVFAGVLLHAQDTQATSTVPAVPQPVVEVHYVDSSIEDLVLPLRTIEVSIADSDFANVKVFTVLLVGMNPLGGIFVENKLIEANTVPATDTAAAFSSAQVTLKVPMGLTSIRVAVVPLVAGSSAVVTGI